MEITRTLTHLLSKEQNSLLWEMSLESARAYNHYLKTYEHNKDYNFCDKLTEEQVKRKYLHSQSFQGSYQLAKSNIIGFYEALKVYNANPDKFTGRPQFPVPDKRVQAIVFKKSAIKYKDKFLFLSTGFRKSPIKLRWNIEKGMPVFATISQQYGEWSLSLIFKEESESKITGNKVLAIDLGIKRLAATFDGETVTLYSGKEVMSLVQLENKKRKELSIMREERRAANKRKYSNKQRRKRKGIKKQLTKIKNKTKDILHKYSRFIVNKAIHDGVKEIVAGDCSSIHQIESQPRKKGSKAELVEKARQQKVNQGQEQKLWKMIAYKFKRVGGIETLIDESYTTQDCPTSCGNRHKPTDRNYRCKCGFAYDRDGVGSINIYKKKVSFELTLERSGHLACPSGVKFSPQLSYKETYSEDRSSGSSNLKWEVLPEPPYPLGWGGCQREIQNN